LRDFPIFLEILPEDAAPCQSGFVAAAGGNSSADANGDITINPGDWSLGVTVVSRHRSVDDPRRFRSV
jgi:hypothetical protein